MMRKNLVRLDGEAVMNCVPDVPVEIRDPALVIDKSTGCVHGWGPAKSMRDMYDRMTSRLTGVAVKNNNDPILLKMASDLVYIGLSDLTLTPEQRCYVLKRCAEMTASGFQAALCEHAASDDVLDWLSAEMARTPMDLTASD